MPYTWYPSAMLKTPPVADEINSDLEYLKEQVDALAGASAPIGTIAWLDSTGAGSGFMMNGPYEKRSDGWLWRPDLHGGLLREEGVAPASIAWTLTDGLARTITKANWEFVLTGSGTASILLTALWSNSATLATRTVAEHVFYGFIVPSGLTIVFQADTGITLERADGTTPTSFSVAGPAKARFLHGSSVWREA